jgi:hypothetical protein
MTFLKTLLITSALLFCAPALFANNESAGTGTVAETMTSGGYVYVRLEEDGSWVASTATPIATGDKVRYTGGSLMNNFTSNSLNRTFESILFAGRLEVINLTNADAHSSVATNEPHAIAKTAAAVAPVAGEITPLEGGKTIVDIRTESQQLIDQQVTLRARVMKISMQILGKNWVTLQDGTGTAPDNKLIATSTEVVAVGDLVTVKGVVKTDVDIGSGYKYAVMMEEATFTK